MDYAIQAAIAIYLEREISEFAFKMIAEEDSKLLRSHKGMQIMVQNYVNEILDSKEDIDLILDTLDKCNYDGDIRNNYWVLDPIDGTKGFISHAKFSVGLALISDGSVVLGVVGCVNLPYSASPCSCSPNEGGCLAVAIRGKGSILYDLDSPLSTSLLLKDPSCIYSATISRQPINSTNTFHRLYKDGKFTKPVIEADSMCKYVIVARGLAYFYFRENRNPSYKENVWDHAAGSIVLEEAGGIVTDLHGKKLDFTHGRKLLENDGILAAIPDHHDRILGLLY
ncbi:hypothetical protein WA171_002921, partial [Blastocystis sp. BT1]